MKIQPNTVVEMDYAVLLENGQVGESTFGRGPMRFIYGQGMVIPGLFQGIAGLSKGDRRTFKVSPSEGYGEYDHAEIRAVPRQGLPSDVEPKVGVLLQVRDPEGNFRLVTITAIAEETLTVDFNHPYAGQTLTFDVLVRDVREATEEELKNGLSQEHDEEEHPGEEFLGPLREILDEDGEPPDLPNPPPQS